MIINLPEVQSTCLKNSWERKAIFCLKNIQGKHEGVIFKKWHQWHRLEPATCTNVWSMQCFSLLDTSNVWTRWHFELQRKSREDMMKVWYKLYLKNWETVLAELCQVYDVTARGESQMSGALMIETLLSHEFLWKERSFSHPEIRMQTFSFLAFIMGIY